jgi:hypothetical protein
MPTEDHPAYPCPRCGAELPAVGEFMVEGRGPYPAYCCENESCADTLEAEGQRFECYVPFTVIGGIVLKLPMDSSSISSGADAT